MVGPSRPVRFVSSQSCHGAIPKSHLQSSRLTTPVQAQMSYDYTLCHCSHANVASTRDASLTPQPCGSLTGLQQLHRDGCFSAIKHRAAKHKERTLVLDNLYIADVCSGTLASAPQQLVIQNGCITAVQPVGSLHDDAIILDCCGLVVLPGLCDAHVHCTAASANLAALLSMPESLNTAHAARSLEDMLSRGFTTVRDAGGADFGLAQAVEQGLILGPRLLFTGHALSQTGGHGDMRAAGEDICACGAALRGIGRVCDGDAEVRRAARDELRKGAHCIKIMASGGVASPTDRLTNNQFSVGEITAIVEEAEEAGTYVCAHAYMPSAIRRAVKAGVRSIEHGNWLDEETADLMAEKGTFLVPTTIVYAALSEAGKEAGMPADLVAKVGNAVQQLEEFKLRGSMLPAVEVIRAATCNCEELFCMQGSIGRVNVGYIADLILVAGGNPFNDLSLLYQQPQASTLSMNEARGVVAVFKQGLLARGCFKASSACAGITPINIHNALFEG